MDDLESAVMATKRLSLVRPTCTWNPSCSCTHKNVTGAHEEHPAGHVLSRIWPVPFILRLFGTRGLRP